MGIKVFVIAFLVSCCAPAFADVEERRVFDHLPTLNEVRADLENPDAAKLAARLDFAVDRMVALAVKRLKRKGHDEAAARISTEWNEKWAGFLPALVLTEGLGDYNPYSQWLADLYQELEDLLGEELCRLLHLDDLRTINFAVPIVLAMHDVLGPVEIDVAEYELHWTPLAGVCAYWTTWVACTVATWGAGAVAFVCTPAGMLSETVTIKWIAPPLADNAYRFFWERQ